MFGPGPADDLLAFLAEERHVRQAGDGRWYWSSENFPASEISLRTAAPENVVIIDTTPDRPRVLGEVDLFSAQVLVHERAIYIHDSVQYYVDRLEWHERKAYVHKIDVDHYTYANRAVTLKPLEVFAEAPATGGDRRHGEVMVASLVTLFKKLKFLTDENVGWGPIDLPELELQTTAYWLTADRARDHWRRDELDVALLGAGRAIQTIAAVLLMVDPRDLGLVTQVRSPHAEEPTIYLYEAVPGGIGLAPRLWERHDELLAGAAALIAGCGCDGGCPSCTGPRLEPNVDARALALRLLAELGAAAEAGTTVIGRRRRDRARRRWPGLRPRPPPRAVPRRGPRRGQPRDRSPPPRADPAHGSRGAARGDARRRGRDRPRRPIRAGRRPVGRHRGRSSAGWPGLPGQPPADRPLVCLDTETTGLATAAGTVAFLIGLGWWEGDRFRQVQLLLPDHADEGALLDELARHIPADAWLVTYNGRGFDWPLLVARYRLARRAAPGHDGHLDLLPIVRRLFRHRMDDARLQTVERSLLGVVRHDDVDGWEIPGRYLGFLRGGPAEPLAAVVRHNDEDVRSLARLIALLDTGYTSAEARRDAPIGDVAGLARAFVRARRPEEALACLEEVLERADAPPVAAVIEVAPAGGRGHAAASRGPVVVAAGPRRTSAGRRGAIADRRAGTGRPPSRRPGTRSGSRSTGRTCSAGVGRYRDAAEAWAGVAAGPGRTAIVAWIELAKLREHRLGDPAGALDATLRAAAAADRRRQLGMPEPALEADLRHRLADSARLRRAPVERLRRSSARLGPARPAPRASADRTVPASRT